MLLVRVKLQWLNMTLNTSAALAKAAMGRFGEFVIALPTEFSL